MVLGTVWQLYCALEISPELWVLGLVRLKWGGFLEEKEESHWGWREGCCY